MERRSGASSSTSSNLRPAPCAVPFAPDAVAPKSPSADRVISLLRREILQGCAPPSHGDARAVPQVVKLQRRAGSCKQCLGDEHAKTKSIAALRRRDVRL